MYSFPTMRLFHKQMNLVCNHDLRELNSYMFNGQMFWLIVMAASYQNH